jgi:hypothetical protein
MAGCSALWLRRTSPRGPGQLDTAFPTASCLVRRPTAHNLNKSGFEQSRHPSCMCMCMGRGIVGGLAFRDGSSLHLNQVGLDLGCGMCVPSSMDHGALTQFRRVQSLSRCRMETTRQLWQRRCASVGPCVTNLRCVTRCFTHSSKSLRRRWRGASLPRMVPRSTQHLR